MKSIAQLFEIGGGPLGPSVKFNGQNGLIRSYLDLMSEKNGFYAFESALLVRPAFIKEGTITDSKNWNNIDLWKKAYQSLQPDAFFFAEDIFGNQFGVKNESIIRFEAETGEVEFFANSIEDWAGMILKNFNLHTGYPIAKAWQAKYGPLKTGMRLILKQPMVLGGNIEIDNMVCWVDVKGMRARGPLAEQIKDVQDGEQIVFKYTD
jgi:hypothetical protein